MKIIAYLRVSCDSQAESGLGLAAQEEACQKYASKLGTSLHTVYKDEGLSGALPFQKRPGMVAALSSLQKGDILLVQKLDRIGRDVHLVSMIEQEIERHGARIISCSGEGTESNDAANVLMKNILVAISKYERDIISFRIKAALNVKKSRGEKLGGQRQFGYTYTIDNGRKMIVEDQEEQQLLELINTMHKQGISVRRIATELNSNNILNRGKLWNHQTIHKKLNKL